MLDNLDELIKLWFAEDIGDGDHTTLSSIPANAMGKQQLIIKEEGIVAGGGTALVNVYNKVAALAETKEGDVATGLKIVLRALEEPVRQIANNAGLEGSIVVDRLKREEVGIGFNAATGEWVNMIEAGIVDPTKVTRSALQNAASVAALFLTTEAVVADIPEPAGGGMGMPDMGGMGGMM